METFEEKRIEEKTILDNDKEIIVSGFGLYDKNNKTKQKHRYYLSIDIKNKGEKELTVIMLNPSEAKEKSPSKKIFIDQTITNIIKMAYDEGYGHIIILNIFSIIEPNPTEIKKYIQHKEETEECLANKKNINYILDIIDGPKDILVAWGDKFKNNTPHKQVKKIIDKLKSNNKNIYTFCNAKKNYPKHPGRIDMNCCRNCYGRNDKINLIPFEFN